MVTSSADTVEVEEKFFSITIASLLLPGFRVMLPTNWVLASILNKLVVEVMAATCVLISIGDELTMFGNLNLNSCSLSTLKLSPNQILPNFSTLTSSTS